MDIDTPPPACPAAPPPAPPAGGQPILAIKDLKKSYGPKSVLNGVSVDIAKGDVLVVLGPNGSGKSTLLRCINLLEPYQQGQVYLKGTLVSQGHAEGFRPSPQERQQIRLLRRHVGMVFQRFHLFPHMTVLENVMSGPLRVLGMSFEQAREVARTMLTRVGLWEKHPCDPLTLSGGQQQRTAIARALAMNPDVMLFDEPTSSLDPLMTKEVFRVIRQLAGEGMTMMLVTHDLDLARDVADRLAFMEGGRISALGSPRELLTNPPTAGMQRFIHDGY